MKLTSLPLVLLALVFFVPSAANADSLSLTQTFGDLEIVDAYSFGFNLSPVQAIATTLGGVTLSLTHKGNSNNPGELWLATSGAGRSIGMLSASTAGNNFVTNSWTLAAEILSEITGQNPWTLTILLYDNTTGTDKIVLKEAGLNVDFTAAPAETETQASAVPEPATAFLLLSGIAITLLRKRNH